MTAATDAPAASADAFDASASAHLAAAEREPLALQRCLLLDLECDLKQQTPPAE